MDESAFQLSFSSAIHRLGFSFEYLCHGDGASLIAQGMRYSEGPAPRENAPMTGCTEHRHSDNVDRPLHEGHLKVIVRIGLLGHGPNTATYISNGELRDATGVTLTK